MTSVWKMNCKDNRRIKKKKLQIIFHLSFLIVVLNEAANGDVCAWRITFHEKRMNLYQFYFHYVMDMYDFERSVEQFFYISYITQSRLGSWREGAAKGLW